MPAAMQRTPSSSSSLSARTVLAHLGQFALQHGSWVMLLRVCPAARCAWHRRACAAGRPRQEQLAGGRQVQRRTPADGAHHLHAGAFAVGALDIDDLVALAHAQVHGLLDEPVEQHLQRAEARLVGHLGLSAIQ
jgi:hypothetical protein